MEKVSDGPGFSLFRLVLDGTESGDEVVDQITAQLDALGATCANGKRMSVCGTEPGCTVAGCYEPE